MKLTKWLVGVLMVMCLMFAVGCSKDDCNSCNGGGICRFCIGMGDVPSGNSYVDCKPCNGSGTCGDCKGTGKR